PRTARYRDPSMLGGERYTISRRVALHFGNNPETFSPAGEAETGVQNSKTGSRRKASSTGTAALKATRGETSPASLIHTVARPELPAPTTATSRPPSLSWSKSAGGTASTAPSITIAS